jgi:ketosteroid isomerase-like protein
MTSRTMTTERLRQFGAAWARGDLDALMGFVTDDCIYLASVGPEPGTTYRGREEVRRGFAAMLAYDRRRERHAGTVVATGDTGFAEWSFTETTPDGGRRLIRGCDLFQFRDGQISKKDAYRKVLGTGPGHQRPQREGRCDRHVKCDEWLAGDGGSRRPGREGPPPFRAAARPRDRPGRRVEGDPDRHGRLRAGRLPPPGELRQGAPAWRGQPAGA